MYISIQSIVYLCVMTEEEKEIELNWQRLLYKVKPQFKTKPSLEGLLFLIGVQELGQLDRTFSKEEKQDLMHVGVCTLLSQERYFYFVGRDEEGWPHYEPTEKLMPKGLKEQEYLIKKMLIRYMESEE